MFSLQGEPIWSNNAANQFFSTGLGKHLTTIVEDGKKLSVLEALFRTVIREREMGASKENDEESSIDGDEVGDEAEDSVSQVY